MSEEAYEIVLVNNSLWRRCKSFAVWSCEGIFCDVSKGDIEKKKKIIYIKNFKNIIKYLRNIYLFVDLILGSVHFCRRFSTCLTYFAFIGLWQEKMS